MSNLRPSLRTAIARALDKTDEMRGHLFHERVTVIENAVVDIIVDGIMANDEPLTEADMKGVEEFKQILARIKAKVGEPAHDR